MPTHWREWPLMVVVFAGVAAVYASVFLMFWLLLSEGREWKREAPARTARLEELEAYVAERKGRREQP